MTSTVTFTKLKRKETTTPNGVIEVAHREYTRAELIALVQNKSPALFTVTEAHASQNLRLSYSYQEVGADVIAEAAAVPKETGQKYASKSAAKRARTQRVGKSDGSNDAPRT